MNYFDVMREFVDVIEREESTNITRAAEFVAKAIMSGGILQAFGSGHSFAGAIEVCGRAGGLIPSKLIHDTTLGIFEGIEGVGKKFMHKVEILPEDVVFLISNSGINPMIIEMAQEVKKVGASLIVVTSYDISKDSTSRHSSGKKLYEFADVILNNHSVYGDAYLDVVGLENKVCGTSSFTTVGLLQQCIYEAVNIMISNDYEPPIYKSANIVGGQEYNEKIELEYKSRIYHI